MTKWVSKVENDDNLTQGEAAVALMQLNDILHEK
jgi:hypothetical protein